MRSPAAVAALLLLAMLVAPAFATTSAACTTTAKLPPYLANQITNAASVQCSWESVQPHAAGRVCCLSRTQRVVRVPAAHDNPLLLPIVPLQINSALLPKASKTITNSTSKPYVKL